jgi:hypothetical protein
MPEIYFNPYPGPAPDTSSGERALVATAEAVVELKKYLDQFHNPVGDIPIREFVLYRDTHSGAQQTIPSVIHSLKGRERELVKRFLLLFDRGQALTADDLNVCRDCVLSGLNIPAPVLEYALRREAMAASLATEREWERDFLEFEGQEKSLPNIYGQSELTPLRAWIEQWHKRYADFRTRLEKTCGLAICQGAMREYAPAPSEHEPAVSVIQKAIERDFADDGYLVKDVLSLEIGTLKQIKHKGSGIRVYIGVVPGLTPCLAGFYKKGQGDERVQNKEIARAGERAGLWISGRQ